MCAYIHVNIHVCRFFSSDYSSCLAVNEKGEERKKERKRGNKKDRLARRDRQTDGRKASKPAGWMSRFVFFFFASCVRFNCVLNAIGKKGNRVFFAIFSR